LEFYVLGDSDAIPGYDGPPALLHYHSFHHSLQLLTELPMELWRDCAAQLPAGSVFLAVSALYWRNVWKYGEPGFRYVQQDIGHALGAIGYAAMTEGACCTLLEGVADGLLAALLGLHDRRPAAQQPQALLALIPSGSTDAEVANFRISHRHLPDLIWSNPATNEGPLPPVCCDCHYATWKARPLETTASIWRQKKVAAAPAPAVASAAAAAAAAAAGDTLQADVITPIFFGTSPGWTSAELRRLILQRRSCHELDPKASISLPDFLQTLRVAMPSMAPFGMLPYSRPLVPLAVFFVHRVQGLKPGIYAFVRDESRLQWLQGACTARPYLWQRVPEAGNVPLFLLEPGDVGELAFCSSSQQEVARSGVATCAVFMEYQPLLSEFGSWLYKRGHWEAGMVIQAMYLAAEEVGSRGTAMGAFLGPWTHSALGISSEFLQVTELWTFGQAVEDSRLETSPGYHHLAELRAQGNSPRTRDAVSTKEY
jgi:hypothetical protein